MLVVSPRSDGARTVVKLVFDLLGNQKVDNLLLLDTYLDILRTLFFPPDIQIKHTLVG